MEQKKTGRGTGPIKRSWLFMGVAGVLVLAATALLAMEYLHVREVDIIGNQHLKTEDIQALTGMGKGSRLFGVSSAEIRKRLLGSAWIREAEVRKDLSGRITARIAESTPTAILAEKERYFLVDRDGRRLEEMRGEPVYFLPLIRIDAEANPEAYREAVDFASAIFEKKPFTGGEAVEITGNRPEEITMIIDRIPVKIGAGDFVRKLDRLRFVRDEIAKRNLAVEYIDMRFVDKVVVKPLSPQSAPVAKKANGRNGTTGKKKR